MGGLINIMGYTYGRELGVIREIRGSWRRSTRGRNPVLILWLYQRMVRGLREAQARLCNNPDPGQGPRHADGLRHSCGRSLTREASATACAMRLRALRMYEYGACSVRANAP